MRKEKLVYITNVRMPTEKAHGIQMIKMCEAFAELGQDVLFVVPKRKNNIKEDPFSYYGVKRVFNIKYVWTIDLINILPWVGYWIESIIFIKMVVLKYLFSSRTDKIIYTREFLIASIFRFLGFKVVYEAHRIVLKKKLFFSLVKNIKYIITNSQGTADEFTKLGFKKVLPLPNGVDLSEFSFAVPKNDLRKRLDLPLGDKIIMYTGNLYDWKGVETLLQTAKIFSNKKSTHKFVIVGGQTKDIVEKKKYADNLGINNVSFLGHKNRKEIPMYLKSSDVLILPNSPVSEESIKYTSPVKLAEYMASGVPIVSSDLPSLRAILGPTEGVFVTPDDPIALQKGIERVLDDYVLAEDLASNALVGVRKYTWAIRAHKILEFINKL